MIEFASPSPDAVFAVQELWQAARKPVNLVMLLDVSGSMAGDKLESLRSAAIEFIDQMGDDDRLTLVAFSSELPIVVNDVVVGAPGERSAAKLAVQGLFADGNTRLYDAVGLGAQLIATGQSSQYANVLVVLSDGSDTASSDFRMNDQLITAAAGNDTTVFAIAYGRDAEEDILIRLAECTNGSFFRGDDASIASIYEAMSAAFGGSAGIGR